MEDVESINKAIADAIKAEGLSVRGMRVVGKVVSTKMKKTVTLERQLIKFDPKYKRWARRRSKIHVHIPDGVSVKVGDVIEAGQTRKLSKTKTWVITKVLKRAE